MPIQTNDGYGYFDHLMWEVYGSIPATTNPFSLEHYELNELSVSAFGKAVK